MSGRESDPDGADSYHPDHPWEQVGHPLYIEPGQRTSLNWPPAPAYPASPREAKQWDALPVRITPEPSWRRQYGYAHPPASPSGVSRPTSQAPTCPDVHPRPEPIWARVLRRLHR